MLTPDEHAAEAERWLAWAEEAREQDVLDDAEVLAQMATAHYLGALVAARGEQVVAELDTTVTRIEPEPSAIHAKRIHRLEADIRELVADAATTRERFENERDAFRGVLSELVDALADGWPDEYDREGESPVVPALRKARKLLAQDRYSFPSENSTSGDSLGSDQITVIQQLVPSTGEDQAAPANHGIPNYAMLDVWMALGGDPRAFDRMWQEDRRTPADTWSQLLAVIRGDLDDLMADTNPPQGPEFKALVRRRTSADQDQTHVVIAETGERLPHIDALMRKLGAKAGQRTAALRHMIEEPCCPTGEETARRALDGTFPPIAVTDVLRSDDPAVPSTGEDQSQDDRMPVNCIHCGDLVPFTQYAAHVRICAVRPVPDEGSQTDGE